ncbi:hypothetical protein HY495_02540 [Candidatus Woesearchaeota archaeon]|nr:hypothetical protein [Candidatus Woesearchaeota archaeon]
MADLTDFAGWINIIESYAHVIFFVLAAYYTWLLIKGGDKDGKSADKAWGAGPAAGKGLWKWTQKTRGKLKRKMGLEEKLVLAEYADLEALKKALNNSKVTDDASLKKAVGSKEKKAKRHEAKAYRRLNQLQKTIDDFELEPKRKAAARTVLNRMTVFTKEIVNALRQFDTALGSTAAFAAKKTLLNTEVDKAITADRGFVAELAKLKKVIYG